MHRIVDNLAQRRNPQPSRLLRGIALWLMVALTALFVLSQTRSVGAHNLNASAVYVYFDPDTQAMLDARINGPLWTPPTPLLQIGDELGIVIKAVPDEGTTTGVGGYTTFYVPNGLQVLDAAYLMPGTNPADGITGYDKVPMHGQAAMPAVGAGGESTVSLVGITRGPNILGVTSPIVTPANTNLGTLPGVYGDTGIFYSTAPETAYGSYTGAPQSIVNNSGDIVGLRTMLQKPLNLWDAWQMAGYGIKGTTNPAYPAAALIDSNQRGYAPWGLANVVAGPQSGYAWEFDFATYSACDPTPTTTPLASCIDQATQDVGPWQRIRYAGSQFADDPPGANPPVQPYTRGANASNSGFSLSPATPLPQTVSQTDNVSPKAVRFAFGQMTYGVPEYVWVKVRVHDTSAILDNTGCPVWTVDTFGGDAGGDSGGKDHIWRYYDPNSVTFNGCLALGKPATREVVKVGDFYQYKLKLYNMGNGDLANVVVRDTLGSGVTYISAVPAPTNIASNVLTWNVGPLLQGDYFEAVITVKASSSGVLNNTVTATGTKGGTPVTTTANEKVVSGSVVLLSQNKSVTPTSVAPGGTVDYTITIDNIGSGPTGNPITINEFLPAGFTYQGPLVSATLNGASVTGVVGVNSSNPNQPVFTIPGSLQAGNRLTLTFTALVASTVAPAEYCNVYRTTQNGIPLETGALACVNVGGGRIGDTIFRDWDGDGSQDAGEEGIAGLTIELRDAGNNLLATTTTDANGNYLFPGLTAGTYTVIVTNPPAGYTLTADPDGGTAHQATIVLATDEQNMDVDFGYEPGGTGGIGDRVFDDQGNDGVFNSGTDVGIPNVVVNLYEDTNGNGTIDADDLLIATDTTDAGGVYGFTNLDPTRHYIVVAEDGVSSPVDTYFTNPYISTTGNPLAVSPADFTASGGNVVDADFGYFGLAPATIEGAVCTNADSDLDCAIADGDTFLPFVDVLLYKDNNNDGQYDPGDTLLQTTTTNPDGTYSFTGVGPGEYVVVVDTSDPNIPGGYFPQVSDIAVDNLTAGQTRTQIDFPFVQTITKAVNVAQAAPGDTLNYTIVVNYPGDGPLTNATVTDPLPDGTTFLAAQQGGSTSGSFSSQPGTPGVDPGSVGSGNATAVFNSNLVTNQANAVGAPNGTVADVVGSTGNFLTLNLGTTVPNATVITLRLRYRIDSGSSIPVADIDGGTNGTTFTGLSTINTLTTSLADYTYTVTQAGGIQYLRIRTRSIAGNANAQHVEVDAVSFASGPGSPATTNTLTATPTSIPTGGVIALSMVLNSNQAVTGVTASVAPVTLAGTASASCALTSASPQNISASGSATFTWDCTTSGSGELSFTGDASGTHNSSPYDFVQSTSNSAEVVITGSAGSVTWNLGSNAAGVPGNTTGGSGSGTVTINDPTKVFDTWLDLNNTSFNYGTCTTLETNRENGGESRIMVRFDLSDIPSGATITAAELRLTNTGGNYNMGNGVYRITSQWDEGTACGAAGAASWNNRQTGTGWTTAGGDFNATLLDTVTVVSAGQYAWDVTSTVDGWIDGSFANYGFIVYSTDGGGNRQQLWASSENTTAANRPQLFVTYSAPAGPATSTTVTASPGLVSDSGQINVSMVLTASGAVNNVSADTLTVADLNSVGTGVSPANCGSPALSSADNDISGSGDSVIYTWTCTADAGTGIGNITFAGSATGDAGGTSFASATSNSVIVAPPLTFQVTVDTPATVGAVENTATIQDGSGAIPPTESNTTYTALTASVGDFVWLDTDGDGVQDAGEPGIGGVEVCATDGVDTFCDVTEADGSYRIFGLDTGTWTVAPDPTTYPLNYQPTTPTSFNAVITSPTQFIDTADFGLRPPGDGSIGDTVWTDEDNDGVLDAGEEPLPGVTLRLYKDDGDGIPEPNELVAVTTTDANGNYLFDGLYADDYLVVVDTTSTVASPFDPAVTTTIAAGMAPTTGTTVIRPVMLATDSTDVTDADFGFNWSGSIGDYVWYDTNVNGLQDEGGLTPIANAEVRLYYDADNDGVIDPGEYFARAATTYTDANGAYLFENLPPGNYLVDVYEDSITTDGNRNIVPTTPNPAQVTLAAGETNLDVDFGYYQGALVQGNVFWDEDRNGVFDASENGLSPVTVYLTPAPGIDLGNGPGQPISTTTDPNGHFAFQVPAGNYTLTYDNPSVLAINPSLTDATTPTSFSFTAIAGEDWQAIFEFGVDNGGTIGDRVWNDADGDDVQDAGEPGLSGVTVQLYLDNDNNGILSAGDTFLAADVTDGSGNYLFEGLPDDDYIVVVDDGTLPTDFGQTFDNNGSQTDHTGEATVSGGGDVLNVDFGYQYQPTVGSNATYTLSGTVYEDVDNNNNDDGEPPLAGVDVTVVCDTIGSVTVTTDVNGDWSVAGIPDGSICTLLDADENDLPSPAFIATETPGTPITVTGNVSNLDFGYNEQLGSISGNVCVGDGNGACAPGELPLDGVTITLTYAGPDGILGTPDDVIDTTTTAPDGSYSFTDLAPGLYQIVETNPPGYLGVGDADGGNPDNISLTLGVGVNATDQDFEDQTQSVIGNRVWVDEDGDGAQDAGEPGIANVTVELYAAGDMPGVDTPIATTTTDANGGYLFSGLPAGDYTVFVDDSTLPAGLAANPTYDEDGTGTPDQSAVTLTAATEHLTADFGYNWAPPTDTDNPTQTDTGAIGDRIWNDADGDGVQDPGEAGLGGVTVELLTDDNGDGVYGGAGDNPPVTTTTSPDGTYIFDDLAPGSYVIAVDETTLPVGFPTQTGDPDATLDGRSNPIALAPGDVFLNADFGYQPTAGSTIGDAVFVDGDGDGIQDPDEPGIPGVTVALLDDNGDVIATDVTDENGQYSFPGLPAGDYTVVVTDTDNVLGELDPISDADGIGTPNTSDVTVNGTTDDLTQDFGYAPTDHAAGEGLIGDTIFLDTNANNAPDAGEGLEGITVELLDAGNAVIATTTTDENGNYFFGGLDDTQTYTVRVVTASLPAGVTNSVDPDGGTANQSTVNLNLDPDGADFDQDFGYTATVPGQISGTVWEDSDADGTLDEPLPNGLGGVTIALLDPDGNVVATTTTAPDGTYVFPNLPAGDYIVDVTDVDNVLDGYWHSTDNDPEPVTLAVGGSAVVDFGYYVEPGALGNFVWADDGDGVQEFGEPGIPNVAVTLVINYANGASTTIVTQTDANGFYSFDNLLLDEDLNGAGAGEPTFTISVATPSGATVTTLGAGTANTDSNDPAGTAATVTQGATNDSYDFGFLFNGTIGDRLWVDEDGDGVQDAGEAGIPNVVIELYAAGDTPGVDTPLATTVSGIDGGYIFKDVPPGDYIVYVNPATLPAGLTANPTYDQDSGTTNPNGTTPVTVASGAEVDDIDFGYNWVDPTDSTNPPQGATGAIGDRVWLDADADGVQDPGEAGLGGVTVRLYDDPDGDGVYDNLVATTTTDADGTYIFDGLTPGAYVVEVDDTTLPAGPNWLQSGDPDATLDNATTGAVLLAPGDVYVNADFGYQPDAGSTIGDTIYVDANGDGTQNAGEPGIPGVTVNLIDNNGNVIATDVTDENGQYSFPDMPAGTYTVQVSDTANVLGELAPISDADGPGTPNESSVFVNGTNDDLTQDFGYAPDGHTGSDGLIGDTIFIDANDNGVLNDGEGVEGVTVELYDAGGNTLLATTTTDENGNYFFGGLDPNGTYTVRVDPATLPGGGAGLTNSIDPDGGSDNEAVVDLSSSGGINFDQDFGYDDPAGTNTGAVTGTIWNDADADGTLDGTEPGRYAGVTVVLLDPDGNIVAQTETDANGNYTFDNVPPGSYTVNVTDDNNVLDGAWHSLGTPNTDGESQPDPAPVTVLANQTANADFGYYTTSGGVGNVVWEDVDGDGTRDGGEPGVPGVPVKLTVTYPNGDVVEMTTVTDANGEYSFPSVLLDEQYDGAGAGEPTFSIEVGLPNNTVSTYDGTPDTAGAGNGTDDNADNHLSEAAYPTQAADDDSNDFGLLDAPLGVDYGDLPAAYSGTTGAGAAAHVLVSSGQIFLGGGAPDAEPDGQPNINATGDLGDEDGIVATDLNVSDNTIRFDVPIGGGGGVLAGWFDLNADGIFGANEFYSVNVPTAGLFQWTITLPNGTPVNNTQPLLARFRLFTSASAAPGGSLDAGDFQGVAVNGEVEDYQFSSATAITLSGLQTATAPTQLTLVLLAALTLLLVTVRARRQAPYLPADKRSARKLR